VRAFIPSVITPEDAEFLSGVRPAKNPKIDHPAIAKIHKTIIDMVDASWEDPAFTRLERLSKRCHDWHIDTGSNNQMPWCKYGCSVLLTDEADAGFLEYRDGFKLEAVDHYCGLAIHSSDVEHRTHHTGTRITYLAFLA
tara:strand:+ start:344 stop:760 length:417 start_codon:yes stop_codon:yes gene_type:complete